MSVGGPLPEQRARILALYDAGMYPRALSLTEAALGAAPQDAWLHALRADLLLHTDHPGPALDGARSALALDPQLAYGYLVLARALMAAEPSSRRTRDAAREAALQAVRLGPTDVAYYTLVRALVRHPRGVKEAAAVARTLGEHHPTSALAPLAMALVSMRRAGMFDGYRWWLIPILTVVTKGLILVWLAVKLMIGGVRRVRHLKHADAHLRRALEMDASSPAALLLAADVLAARFRFSQAVDHQVTAGALRSDLVDASAVVARIGRRVTLAIVAAYLLWVVLGFLLHRQLAGWFTGPLIATVLLLSIVEFRRRQAASLPPTLRAALDRRFSPVAASWTVAVLVALPARSAGLAAADGRSAFALAALVGALLTTGVFVRGQRSKR